MNACRLQKTRSSRERGGPPDIRRTSPHFVRRRSRSGRHRPLRLRRRLVSAAALYTKRRSQIAHRPPTSYNPAKKPIDLPRPRISRPRKTARLALSARKPTWKSLTSPARLHAMTVVNGTPNLLERSHKRRTPTRMGLGLRESIDKVRHNFQNRTPCKRFRPFWKRNTFIQGVSIHILFTNKKKNVSAHICAFLHKCPMTAKRLSGIAVLP